MAELMATADLAIGAGGSASWERCCLGLPALLVVLAENQIDIVKGLGAIGACVYISTAEITVVECIRFEIDRLLMAYNELEVISKRAFALVDGVGVNRVTKVLGCQK
jgi:spore coat polysaccharide biosynthesis predicted glycosyltransferase SpsG